nr:NADAR domain-containing protein [Paenibacillus beijingensis]
MSNERYKMEQHEEVKQILMSTGNCLLVEHTSNDSFWGDNGDGTGRNMLGQILMEVRNEQEGYSPEFFLPQWIVYPEHHPFSLFWRMGRGEDYLLHLWEWQNGLSKKALQEYDAYFVPPEEWKDEQE